jgi:hypothetical protein
MALAPLNPTNLTPPRVALIDERSGAISREWYRFFLSLLTATQTNQAETELTPNANSLLASYDSVFGDAVQSLASQPASASVDDIAALRTQLQALESRIAEATAGDIGVLQSELQALALNPPPKQYLTPRYGSFYDTTTQTAATINTAYAMTFNTTDLSNGVTIGSPTSRIYVDRPNVYNVQFSAQIDKTSGGVGLVWVWLRKNGVDVPDSSGQIRIQGNNAEILAAWNYILQLNAGDYIEMMWEVDDTSVILLAEAASAVHPSVPSVILTVTDNVSSLEV